MRPWEDRMHATNELLEFCIVRDGVSLQQLLLLRLPPRPLQPLPPSTATTATATTAAATAPTRTTTSAQATTNTFTYDSLKTTILRKSPLVEACMKKNVLA